MPLLPFGHYSLLTFAVASFLGADWPLLRSGSVNRLLFCELNHHNQALGREPVQSSTCDQAPSSAGSGGHLPPCAGAALQHRVHFIAPASQLQGLAAGSAGLPAFGHIDCFSSQPVGTDEMDGAAEPQVKSPLPTPNPWSAWGRTVCCPPHPTQQPICIEAKSWGGCIQELLPASCRCRWGHQPVCLSV